MTQNVFEVIVRLLLPADERALHGHLDVIVPANRNALRGGQAVVDDAVTVVVSGIVVQRRFQRPAGLIERFVADGVQLDLQSRPVGFLAEIHDLPVVVVQHALAARLVGVGGVQRRVVGAEAAVQGAGEAAADTGKVPAGGRFYLHALGEDANLKSVFQPLGKKFFQCDVQISRKAHAADGVDAANAPAGLKIHRRLHIANQLGDGQGIGQRVGKGEKRLLIHFPRVRVVAPKVLYLAFHGAQKLGVDDTGVAVILYHHDFLVGTHGVQLLTADEPPLLHAVGGRAEGDQRLFRGPRHEPLHHLHDLGVGRRVHDVQPCVEGGEGRKVLVGVHKGGNKGFFPQGNILGGAVLPGQVISHIYDFSTVFHEVTGNVVILIDRQDVAFVAFHSVPSLSGAAR